MQDGNFSQPIAVLLSIKRTRLAATRDEVRFDFMFCKATFLHLHVLLGPYLVRAGLVTAEACSCACFLLFDLSLKTLF